MRTPANKKRRLLDIQNGFRVLGEHRSMIEAGEENGHPVMRFINERGFCVLRLGGDTDGGHIEVRDGSGRICLTLITHGEGGTLTVQGSNEQDGESPRAELNANHESAALTCSLSAMDFSEIRVSEEVQA